MCVVSSPMSRDNRLSIFLCYILRHNPGSIGLTLDSDGWASVNSLMDCCSRDGRVFDLITLRRIVATDTKGRYSLDGDRIRANQGHSIDKRPSFEQVVPPDRLFHGTSDSFIPSILANGLNRGQRHHVHLSTDIDTAKKVGARRGTSVILEIKEREMSDCGVPFFLSTNNVWLVDHVPPAFLSIASGVEPL